MYFNNPNIILSDTDAILGAVRVSEEVDYLNLMNRISSVLEYHIRKDVEDLMSPEIPYRKALTLTANKCFEILDTYYKEAPIDEAHLAEMLMESRNFEMWSSDIQNRFTNYHKGITNAESKIASGGEGGLLSQEEAKEIAENNSLDNILATLAMYMDIGNPSNLY